MKYPFFFTMSSLVILRKIGYRFSRILERKAQCFEYEKQKRTDTTDKFGRRQCWQVIAEIGISSYCGTDGKYAL